MTVRALVVIVLCALAAPALGDPAAAKAHVEQAMAHHAAGRYAEALEELERAYAADARPDLLYAIAQVHVKLDRCADAIGYYERFLATGPSDKARQATREAITACRARLAAIAQASPEPAPEAAPAPATERAPEPAPPHAPEVAPGMAPERHRWYADPFAGIFAGAGLASAVTAALIYRAARSDVDAAARAETYGRSEELVDRAGSRRTYALITGGAGVVLLGAAVVRYVLAWRAAERDERGRSLARDGGGARPWEVAIVPTPDGAAVAWSGRF